MWNADEGEDGAHSREYEGGESEWRREGRVAGEREADKVRTDSVVNCIALCILQYNYSPSKNT